MPGSETVRVRIPTPLRPLVGGQSEVQGSPGTLGALIEELDRRYPGLKDRLLEPDGSVRRFINVFVNEEDVRFLAGLDTQLQPGDRVSVLPAVAGGER
jgi:molybdopterin synthase sulfur carrier subunit